MSKREFYLYRPETRSADAVFRVLVEGAAFHVVAEIGMTGCWDKLVDRKEAHELYRQLLDKGWIRAAVSRRTLEEIQRDIRD